MKIAIGAIFRDEYDYIIEWLAWHQMAGFETFYIADNASTDGTTQLLEALADLGYIKLIYQPVLEKHAQIVAYKRILHTAIRDTDVILFIDADEFITHESMEDGAEARLLQELFLDSSVGMVGINWRTFGSSGHDKMSKQPVIERFNYHAKNDQPANQLLKSASKIALVNTVNPHSTLLYDPFCYVDGLGKKIDDFIHLIENKYESVKHSGRRAKVLESPLRINHYVIKSKFEFEKKRKRGDGMLGINYDRGIAYFQHHDFKDEYFSFPSEKIERLKQRMQLLTKQLEESTFGENLKGIIDFSNFGNLSGWCVNAIGTSDFIKINIFVNGIYQGSTHCGFYRPDLLEKGVSKTGMSGFRWTHVKPLNSGDIVEVKVHANRFKFPQRAYTVIE